MGTWLEHERLGFNYRLDELSAALGVSQIARLDTFLAKRARVAEMYSQRLEGLGWVRTPVVRDGVAMSWFVYVVTLASEVDRAAVIGALAAEGIPSRAYFSPLHLQPYIRERFGTEPGTLPVTEDIAGRTLALPFHNNVTEEQVERVIASLERAVAPRA
jgi:perosamine synthetase